MAGGTPQHTKSAHDANNAISMQETLVDEMYAQDTFCQAQASY